MTVTSGPNPAVPAYTFDNEYPEAAKRLDLLAEIGDEFTVSRLSSLGGDLAGRRCLELGTGRGSIAGWLAEQAGPTGYVLATDINTRHIPPDHRYTVLGHDLAIEPIPEGPWDVIHARLVLAWMTDRHNILRRLAAALAPGGWLAIEEWDHSRPGLVLSAPKPEVATLFYTYLTIIDQIVAGGGVDRDWPWQVHDAMVTVGLVNVDTVVNARSWPGGSAGALLHVANINKLRTGFLAAGMTGEQLADLSQALHDPRMVIRGMLTVSTLGRRPAS